MKKFRGLLKFTFSNFGPILIFYLANHFYGITVAVCASIVWTIGEVVLLRLSRKPVGTFFKFSATIAIVFGLVDMYFQKSLLFQYEASLTNVMVGLFFLSSLFGEKPIIREFAEAQGRISKELSPDSEYYFKFLTIVWSVYMFAKAAFYFWVAAKFSLEEGLVIRSVVGNVTFYGLLAISIFGSKQIKFILAKLKLLPSVATIREQREL
jgi:intracellular septation protein A